jgi:hypothetical protein
VDRSICIPEVSKEWLSKIPELLGRVDCKNAQKLYES